MSQKGKATCNEMLRVVNTNTKLKKQTQVYVGEKGEDTALGASGELAMV